MYNDTGPNRLNLSYRHSAVNIAYVISSTDPSDEVNATFIAYRNVSSSNGFNSTGHLYPGSSPVWTTRMAVSSESEAGDYTYHLFIATFDPEGKPGLYQVRVNITGTLEGGSNWTYPDGNPNVPWMFFQVPEGTSWPVSVSDQLGRYSPFFFDTPIPTTHLNASLVVKPSGNSTGETQALVRWNNTNGSTIITRNTPIYYVGEGRWATHCVVEADNSTFPANYTHPYRVQISMGSYEHSASFSIYPLYAAIRPDTWLVEPPPAVTDNETVLFKWTGSDLDGKVIGYSYRMDSGPWQETENTSRLYTGLSNGTHRFEVKSRDDDGLFDPSPAYKEFVVIINSPPETNITQHPNQTTSVRDVFFAWSGNDMDGSVTLYEFRLDYGNWTQTTSQNLDYLNLSSGDHVFQVRAMDNRGLLDPSPATFNFTITKSWCERELERLRGLVEELRQQIFDLNSTIDDLNHALESCEDEKAVLSQIIQDLQDERAELLDTIEGLEEDRQELIDQIQSLSSDKADLEEMLQSCQESNQFLQEKLLRMNQTISQLLMKNQQLTRSNQYLLDMIKDLRDRIEELESQVPEIPARIRPILFAALAAFYLVSGSLISNR